MHAVPEWWAERETHRHSWQCGSSDHHWHQVSEQPLCPTTRKWEQGKARAIASLEASLPWLVAYPVVQSKASP